MKLSTKSRYAARLMLRLAHSNENQPVQLSDIARIEGISEKYLSQIVIPLKLAGFIKAIRGARGGYLLSEKKSEISLYDIVNVMEGGIELLDCLKDDIECSRSSHCATKFAWDDVTKVIEETLKKYTLDVLLELDRDASDPMYYI